MIGTIWSMAMMIALYQPFMRIWTKEDPALMRHVLTPLLMACCFFVLQARQILLVFKAAADIWHQDRWKPLCASCLNLGLNILFVIVFPENYKLDGVILSTIIATVFVEAPWEAYIMFTHFFDPAQAPAFLKLQARFVLVAVLLSIATWYGANAVPFEGVPGLVMKGIVAAIISGSIMLAIFHSDIKNVAITLLNKNK
jgi:peptidoglycan biosynthesis protein MviN/MurJ (putative lipid II flippase)